MASPTNGSIVMRKTKLFMDTIVDIQVVTCGSESVQTADICISRAFDAFRGVEQACSRFSSDSELMLACARIGVPVSVSPLLFEPLRFALEMARITDGAYDPSVGKRMELHGFNRHYLTGQRVISPCEPYATYRDIELNEHSRTLLLHKPMTIDLGAVAKGFAIDLAASELKSFPGFLINAGGDLYAGGRDADGEDWEIGIQHPEQRNQTLYTIRLSDQAVCTSGSYARQNDQIPGMHHLIDARTGMSVLQMVSCSVIAPYAMIADAFSTSAFLIGREEGTKLIEEAGLRALFIDSDLQITAAGGIDSSI